MRSDDTAGNGLILHTGAIGDCLLTLPLAAAVKNACGLQRLDFIGPAEYIEFYPGRTCIDTIKSVESIPLHRFFAEPREFETSEHDRLAELFRRYEHVISFLGCDNPAFETNLLFAVHCTHSAEVTMIPAKPNPGTKVHVTDFYMDFFRSEHQLETPFNPEWTTVTPLPDDFLVGADLLQQAGVDPDRPMVLIHPGSGSREKCWHWENFVQTAYALQAHNIQPVFLIGPAELERFDPSALKAIGLFDVLENLSLTQVVQVLTQAEAFIGNDSGIAHLAAGMGKKTLALFAAGEPSQYAPRGANAVIEQFPADRFSKSDALGQTAVIKKLLDML